MHSTEDRRNAPDERGDPCADAEEHCALCGDQAVPMRVRSVDTAAMVAEAVTGDTVMQVALDLVEDVRAGDTLLVHQGFAIARVEDT